MKELLAQISVQLRLTMACFALGLRVITWKGPN